MQPGQGVLQSVVRGALAAEHGYADQADLVHDFRDLTSITPAAYRPRSYQERNHVPA